jgi:hypothetical protein
LSGKQTPLRFKSAVDGEDNEIDQWLVAEIVYGAVDTISCPYKS